MQQAIGSVPRMVYNIPVIPAPRCLDDGICYFDCRSKPLHGGDLSFEPQTWVLPNSVLQWAFWALCLTSITPETEFPTAKLQYSSLSEKWRNCYRNQRLLLWPLLIIYIYIYRHPFHGWLWNTISGDTECISFPSPPTFKAVPTTFLPKGPA